MSNFYNSKNVLVAGGAGFVGTNLIDKLVSIGANVKATLYANNPIKKHNEVEYIHCDLTNSSETKKICQNIDYVFMCAANTSGAKVISNTPLVHLTPNILMNMNMLESAYENRVNKFLFLSSNTVYPLTDHAVKESDVNNVFYDSYHIVAWMKRFTEIVCDMYSTRISKPMNTLVVRPGNLYGPYDKFDWEKSKVIPALIRRAVEKHDPFEVWGDGMDLKDFLYIDDFIDGILLAMESINNFQPINIAYGSAVTIKDVLKEILIATNYKDAEIIYDESKPTMIPKRMIDIRLAKTKLNWYPKINLKVGIQKTVDWYVNHYKNKSPEENI